MDPGGKILLTDKDLSISVCSDQDSLTRYSDEWDSLLIDNPQRSPMLSYAWVSAYLQHRLSCSETWFTLFAIKSGNLVGVLPLIASPYSLAGYDFHILSTPNDSHTLGGDILVVEDLVDQIIPAMFRAANLLVTNLYAIVFYRVVENSPTLTYRGALSGILRTVESAGIGYYFPVTGNFENYFIRLAKKFRGNIRRAETNIKEFLDLRLTIKERGVSDPDDFKRFITVEASGWKGKEGSAIACSPELTAFYTTLTQRLANSGMLRWEFLEYEDHILAANLSVRFGGIVVIWKLGYDEKFSKYSPGGLLFKAVLEKAFSDNSLVEFNLMSDTAWQINWNPEHRNYNNIYYYPLKPLPLITGFLPRQIKAVMRKYKWLVKLVRSLKRRLKSKNIT